MIVVALVESRRRRWPCGLEEVTAMVQSYFNNVGRKTSIKKHFPKQDWQISFKTRWSSCTSYKINRVLKMESYSNFLLRYTYKIMYFKNKNMRQGIRRYDEKSRYTNLTQVAVLLKFIRWIFWLLPNCGKAM